MPRFRIPNTNIYGPRRPKSQLLVLAWVGTFVFAITLIWYLQTRHPETSQRYADYLKEGRRQKGGA
jgi:hypothetical protein